MRPDELEGQVFDLVGYMVVSARNLIRENPLYGPFRLVDAASRLLGILAEQELASPRLSAIRACIEDCKYSVVSSREEFEGFLEAVVDALVNQMEGG